VRMAVRRTRMLGNGCQEPVLIDGCLLRCQWIQKRSGSA
jgi:hypothetical protein